MDSGLRDLVGLFLVLGGGLLVLWPLARALTKRINASSAAVSESPALGELRDELRQVRQEVAELAERVDFAERALAQHTSAQRLVPPA